MKIICPKCQIEIHESNININEGFARCGECNDFFKLADYLRHSEEIARIKKPYYSKVELIKSGNMSKIYIPPNGWNGTSIFFLFFSSIWIIVPVIILTNAQETPLFVAIPLFIGLLIFGIFIYMLKGHIEINIDRYNINIKWSALGFGFTKTRNTSNLIKITEDVVYTQNYQPVYGVGLFFKDQGKIKFGSNLKEEERKWLIGELYEIKNMFDKKQFA